MRYLTEQEQFLVFSHIPRFARTFYFHPPVLPDDLADLNMTHIKTLVFLRMNGPSPMSPIARWLNLEKGSFTSVARRLLGTGFVESVTDDADRRRTLLRMTPEGEAFYERMHALLAEGFAQRIDGLTPSEQRMFFASLEKIRRLLTKMNPESGCASPLDPTPFAQEGTPPCSD